MPGAKGFWGGSSPPPPPSFGGAELLEALKEPKKICGLNYRTPKAPEKSFDWLKARAQYFQGRGVQGEGGGCGTPPPPPPLPSGAELLKGALSRSQGPLTNA